MKNKRHWYLVEYIDAKDVLNEMMCLHRNVLINQDNQADVYDAMNFLTYQNVSPQIISVKRVKEKRKQQLSDSGIYTYDKLFSLKINRNEIDETPIEIIPQYYL